jgi:hypothetical protein
VLLDLSDLVGTLAPAPAALQAIREEASRKGSNKLTLAPIDHEVAVVRKRTGGAKLTSPKNDQSGDRHQHSAARMPNRERFCRSFRKSGQDSGKIPEKDRV